MNNVNNNNSQIQIHFVRQKNLVQTLIPRGVNNSSKSKNSSIVEEVVEDAEIIEIIIGMTTRMIIILVTIHTVEAIGLEEEEEVVLVLVTANGTCSN